MTFTDIVNPATIIYTPIRLGRWPDGNETSESYSTATQLRSLVAMSTELAETQDLQH